MLTRSVVRRILISIALLVVIILFLTIFYNKPTVFIIKDILLAYDEGLEYKGLTIKYPFDETVFPPEIIPQTFQWEDANLKSDTWLVTISFEDNKPRLNFLTHIKKWTPTDKQWEVIKDRSMESPATVTIIGVNKGNAKNILSVNNILIATSRDEVASPIFYREVNLPFIEAIKDPSHIRWRFGEISSKVQPPIILENLPVCGNCHSFSMDGEVMAMDVDYANDKGSYAITAIDEQIVLDKSKIITWSDYKKEDKEFTYGLLSQISPDGKYVVSTVKDRSVFVPKPDLEYSQLFFPVKGILAVYSRDTGIFNELPGASDKKFVQSNPAWSPDGKYIIFARSKMYDLVTAGKDVLLTEEECHEFLKEGKTFLFDLYRIPFNDGRGGVAEPIKGASYDGMSNYFPKYSPDGRWIVFCKASSFMLLQPDSELYIIPSEGGEARRMRCNMPNMNSWHSWSPNGKWLVFSSKANTLYTQLFLAHIDEEGHSSPPVLLSQFTSSDRAANIPEFVNIKPTGIKKIREAFLDDVSFLRAGNVQFKGEDFREAVQAYKTALELNPDNYEAHNNLGTIFAMENRIDEAIFHYREAIRIMPNNSKAYNNLGIALVMQNKLKEALDNYRKAIELNQNDFKAEYNIGVVLVKQNKLDEAIMHYTRALELNPRNEDLQYNMGLALWMQGKSEESIGYFEEALRLNPDNVKAHNNIGRALGMQGRFKEAISHFTEVFNLDSNNKEAHNGVGFVLQQQGKIDGAIMHYTEALRIDPEYLEAHKNLGDVLMMKGETEKAITHYIEALRINPNFEQARFNLNRALQQKTK